MTFAIVGNLDKPGLPDAIRRFISELEAVKAEYLIDRRMVPLLPPTMAQSVAGRLCDERQCAERSDIVVAFGGDGTILSVARLVGPKGTPILGVNLGKLGFLAEFGPEELERAIADILAGKYIVEERMLLHATSPAVSGGSFYAVNDVVIDKSRSSRVINLETNIDGAFAVTYRGDGVIISTPTGSTAYALSNGGPIVTPTSRVIGITPIAPHTLSGRPLVVPDTSRIRVAVNEGADEVLFSVDGQREGLLRLPAEVIVEKAPHVIRLVKRTDRSYFDVLRAKLFWGQDARLVSSQGRAGDVQ